MTNNVHFSLYKILNNNMDGISLSSSLLTFMNIRSKYVAN
jgi:hypothetical protein